MNKTLSSLLVLSVVFNTAAPALNAAEILTDAQPVDLQAEMSTLVEKNEVEQAVAPEMTRAEVTAQKEQAQSSDVASEATSEVASEETTEVESTDATGDSFFIWTAGLNDGEITAIDQAISGGFVFDPSFNSSVKAGATITLNNVEGYTFSNLYVGLGDEDESTALVAGVDYSVEGQTITMLHDFEKSDSIVVTYDQAINNGSTNVLAAQSDSWFTDVNDNGVFDEGVDYMQSDLGYTVEITNGTVTNTKNILLDAAIAGGELALTGNDANIELTDGVIAANANFTVENTGDFAIDLTSIAAGSAVTLKDDFVASLGEDNSSKYYAFYSDETYTLSIDGVELDQTYFTSTSSEYLNPAQTLSIDVTYTTDASETEYAMDLMDNLEGIQNNSEAFMEVDYGKNVFGEYLDQELMATAQFPDVTNPDVTDPDVTDPDTDTDVTDPDTDVTNPDTDVTDTNTDTDGDYVTMVEGENNYELATTGSNTMELLAVLVVALMIAFVAKVKLAIK